MSTIFTLLMVLIIIASILLVIIILAQNPKGGGLSGTFGGVSSAQFGVQRTNDFMEKSTWTLGITIVLLILLSVILTGKPSSVADSSVSVKKEATTNQKEIPAQTKTEKTTTKPEATQTTTK